MCGSGSGGQRSQGLSDSDDASNKINISNDAEIQQNPKHENHVNW